MARPLRQSRALPARPSRRESILGMVSSLVAVAMAIAFPLWLGAELLITIFSPGFCTSCGVGAPAAWKLALQAALAAGGLIANLVAVAYGFHYADAGPGMRRFWFAAAAAVALAVIW